MNKLTKIFFALAVVAAFGAADALAQCAANSTSPIVRSEATVELIGSVTINCVAAPGTSQASISITLNPATTVFVNTTGTVDNRSVFPAPTLQESSAAGGDTVFCTADDTYVAVTNLTSLGAGTNTLTFTFNPTGANLVVCVSGLRANINASGLPAGSTLTSNVVTGGSISAITNTLIVGVVNAGLRTTGAASTNPTGFPTALNLLTCTAGTNTVVVNLAEGFASAWQDPEPDAATAGTGTRFRITISGVPTGVTVNAPDSIGGVATALSGTLDANATTDAIVLTRVDGTAADGSGGTLAAVAAGDDFDAVTLSGGAGTIVYEVTAMGGIVLVDGVTINLQIVTTVGSGVGTITGSIGFGPVGPPTGNAHRPQFAAAGSATVANVADCATRLIFSWVVNTAGYDTGIAIANTSEDDAAFGTGAANGATAQSGTCTLTGYPAAGGSTVPFTTASIPAGQTVAFSVSGVTGFSGFAGYVLAKCNFLNGHAFAFITNGFGSTAGPGLAQGYQALVVPSGTRGASAGEGLGQ